ncbi:hypothetical protein BB561_002563 [Smittium simulii]|uniref:HMG box domain-containing protein n=1 Tax=Smittium simulii TaxID=133385 RepID=A0A2T9YQ19_9FUNG|nr:hypothetical protein BB561_002563 [Smittium simulii]
MVLSTCNPNASSYSKVANYLNSANTSFFLNNSQQDNQALSSMALNTMSHPIITNQPNPNMQEMVFSISNDIPSAFTTSYIEKLNDIPSAFTTSYTEKSNNTSESALNLSCSDVTLNEDSRFYQNITGSQDSSCEPYSIGKNCDIIHMYNFGDTDTRATKANKAKRTPRPPNSFILYRKDKQEDVIKTNLGVSNKEISIIIGKMWKSESPETKEKYKNLAENEKNKHKKLYPDYKYQPRKSKKCSKSDQDVRYGSSTLFNPPLQTKMFHPGSNFAEYNSYSGAAIKSLSDPTKGNFVDMSQISTNNNSTQTAYNNTFFKNNFTAYNNIQGCNKEFEESIPYMYAQNNSFIDSSIQIPSTFKAANLSHFNRHSNKDIGSMFGVSHDAVNDAIDSSYISTMVQRQVTHVNRNLTPQENLNNMQIYSARTNAGLALSKTPAEQQVDTISRPITSDLKQSHLPHNIQNSSGFDCEVNALENIHQIIRTGTNNQNNDFMSNEVNWNNFPNSPGINESLLPQSFQENQFFSIPKFNL